MTELPQGATIGILRSRPEQPCLLAISGHAVTAEIIEMRSERRGPCHVAHHARLDDGAACAGGDETIGLDAGALAAPEAGAIAGSHAAGSRDATAGLLRGGERLRDEGPGLLSAGRADAPRPYAELVFIGHDTAPHGARQ